MIKLDELKIGYSGNEYLFNENEELMDYLRDIFPELKFEATLSLVSFHQRNLHQLTVITPPGTNLTYTSPSVQNSMITGLVSFLEHAVEDMQRNKVPSATVHLSRIELGTFVNPTTLKSSLYAHLRACFVQD